MTKQSDRAEEALEVLEFDLAMVFAQSVEKFLRNFSDHEINKLYLMTHTAANMGDPVDDLTAVLMPLVAKELDLRRDISVVPALGPTLAPELYQKGGAHAVPF